MASLFALGVMSVPWMIMFAGLIAAEKLLPSKTLANRSIALVLIVLGLGVALLPASVPGLTLPHRGSAAMGMMSH
jgi:predicted metal-binding membrane protein